MSDPITLMTTISAVSAASSAISGGIAAMGTIAQGNADYAAAKAERVQLNRMASEELAVATRDAEAKQKEADLLMSRGRAVAAASGGSATDDTVLQMMGNIARDANVQTRDILRSGQVKADDLLYRGNTGVALAKQNRGLSRLAAGGQIIGSIGDAFAKYGQGLPQEAKGKAPKVSVAPSQQDGPWYNWG